MHIILTNIMLLLMSFRNIILDMNLIIFQDKKINCDNGMNIITLKFCEIKDEIYKVLYNGYKFRFNSIRCELYYQHHKNFGIRLYAYINISVLDNSILEKLKISNLVNYNDKLWIGLFIDNINNLSLDDIIYDDEKYLINENNFKLPSYAVAKCRKIIHNYLYYTKRS